VPRSIDVLRLLGILLAALALLTSRAEAFGLSDVISDLLYHRETAAADARPRPTATLFFGTGFTVSDERFDFGSIEQVSYGGQVGALYALHEPFLFHAGFSGTGSRVKVTFAGEELEVNGRFLDARLGGSVVYVDSAPLKAWLTLDTFLTSADTSESEAFWVWEAGLSTTLSWRLGDVLLEPNAGIAVRDTFDLDTQRLTAVGAGFAAKYRGTRWRPQVNFAYSKIVDPDLDDDGFISVGPELTYAVTPSLLLGVSYTYGRPVDRDIRFDSHSATFRIRWTF
jgi:hypothetical protein